MSDSVVLELDYERLLRMSRRESRQSRVRWGRAPRGSWAVVWAGVVLVMTILILVGIVLPWLLDQMD